MRKIEKVYKGLECCASRICYDGGCPYHDQSPNYGIDDCTSNLTSDALALIRQQHERIKELEGAQKQEPALLENQHKPYGHFINANSPWISRCPKCGKKVEGKQTRYCKYCGQAVKWDG